VGILVSCSSRLPCVTRAEHSYQFHFGFGRNDCYISFRHLEQHTRVLILYRPKYRSVPTNLVYLAPSIPVPASAALREGRMEKSNAVPASAALRGP
jgi:hypothetical protein